MQTSSRGYVDDICLLLETNLLNLLGFFLAQTHCKRNCKIEFPIRANRDFFHEEPELCTPVHDVKESELPKRKLSKDHLEQKFRAHH